MRGERGVTAAIDKPEHVVFRDLLCETNATRTKNAALVVERDPRTEFDQAHAAVAGRGKFLVITIARHIAAGLLARFDQAGAFGELPPDAVDLHVDHWWSWC